MKRMDAITKAEQSEHCITPAEAFSLLANDTRVKILETLWQADEQPVSFSKLHEAVEVSNSSKFNYHLSKLSGQFIRRTEQGYELRNAGRCVVRMIVKGSLNAHPQPDPISVGDPCTLCGEPLLARYEDETLAIECPTCGRGHGRYPFPPGGMLGRCDEEVLVAFDRRVIHHHSQAGDGVCPECSGPIQPTFEIEEVGAHDATIFARHICKGCNYTFRSPVGLNLLNRQPVIAFYQRNGINLRNEPFWRHKWCVSDDCTLVRSFDPLELDVVITIGSESLCMRVDTDLTISNCRRTVL